MTIAIVAINVPTNDQISSINAGVACNLHHEINAGGIKNKKNHDGKITTAIFNLVVPSSNWVHEWIRLIDKYIEIIKKKLMHPIKKDGNVYEFFLLYILFYF